MLRKCTIPVLALRLYGGFPGFRGFSGVSLSAVGSVVVACGANQAAKPVCLNRPEPHTGSNANTTDAGAAGASSNGGDWVEAEDSAFFGPTRDEARTCPQATPLPSCPSAAPYVTVAELPDRSRNLLGTEIVIRGRLNVIEAGGTLVECGPSYRECNTIFRMIVLGAGSERIALEGELGTMDCNGFPKVCCGLQAPEADVFVRGVLVGTRGTPSKLKLLRPRLCQQKSGEIPSERPGEVVPPEASPRQASPRPRVVQAGVGRYVRIKPGQYVRIRPGTFMMGSPTNEPGRYADETQHKVTLTHAFMMKVVEVTQGEWLAVMGSNPSYYGSCGASCPVEQVSWYDAIAYANGVSQKEGLERCYKDEGKDYDMSSAQAKKTPSWPKGLSCAGYRLPTEAEWEYAARAGTTTAYHTGAITAATDEDPNLDKAGWYNQNTMIGTHPVGGKAANAWGLHDVHGNVWEWVWDWNEDYGSGEQADPVGPSTGPYRVLRGGSWDYSARYCRSAYRLFYAPGSRRGSLGIRLSRSIH